MAIERASALERLRALDVEESVLAKAALAGDRAAFDALFDRYLRRVGSVFRDLPDREAKARIWQALEAIFASLDADDATPLAARAFRVALVSRRASTRVPVRVRERERVAPASARPDA